MENFNINECNITKVMDIYSDTISSLDKVLIGQKNVKKVVASAILSDTNSKILLTGNTGVGKTTLVNFLASGFNTLRISVTSDMIPSEVQEQLKDKNDLKFLQIDEFNRASGKVQSVFIELFGEKQMTIDGVNYSFNDFYVFATQNSADIAGIFNVPQAVYDRFDVNIFFGDLSEGEKRKLLFGDFVPLKVNLILEKDILFIKGVVDNFRLTKLDEDLIMQIFSIIDNLEYKQQKMFAGSNIRAHKFAIRLAKFNAIINGRNYIEPIDVADFIKCLYRHRIDQNVCSMNDANMDNYFYDAQRDILKLRRKR